MRRRYRIMLSAVVLAASIALVGLFVLAGRSVEGPIASALSGIGTVVSRVESAAARHFRSPGRAAELAWADAVRTHPDSLRSPRRILLGAFDGGMPASLDGVLELERALGTTLPLIQIYTAWGDRPTQRFPTRLAQAVRDIGSIPLITWEPWLADFENRLHPALPLRDERDRGGLAAIAAGMYDFYIDAWARDAAHFGAPLLLRYGHEMNDPYRYPWGPQNNSPADYNAAWRHVVARFRAAGAHNVVWVWSPHVAYEGYDAFYPGDDVVDWTATGVLNYGTVAHWSQWWSFEEIFGQKYDGLARFGKPIMIAEFGTLAVGGSRTDWLDHALRELPRRYPAAKALVFFHVAADRTVTYQSLDWSILDDSAAVRAVREALATW